MPPKGKVEAYKPVKYMLVLSIPACAARVRDKGMVYDKACVSGEAEVYGEGRAYQAVQLLDTEMVDYDIVQRNNKRQADNAKSAEKVPPKKRVVVKKNTSKKPKTRS